MNLLGLTFLLYYNMFLHFLVPYKNNIGNLRNLWFDLHEKEKVNDKFIIIIIGFETASLRVVDYLTGIIFRGYWITCIRDFLTFAKLSIRESL